MMPFIGLILLFLMAVIWLIKPRQTALGKMLTNVTTFSTNQFNQKASVGDLAITTNPNPFVIYVVWQPGGTGTLVPGEGVILDDLGASDYVGIDPLVDKRAATADAIEGIVIFDLKKATKSPGDRIAIATKGAYIWMYADAALTRGTKVQLNLAKPGYVDAVTTGALCGKLMDKSSAQDDLVRVKVLAEGVV